AGVTLATSGGMRIPTLCFTFVAMLAIGCAGSPSGSGDDGSGGGGSGGGGSAGSGGGGSAGSGGGGAGGSGGGGAGGGGGTTGGAGDALVFSPYKDTSINMN